MDAFDEQSEDDGELERELWIEYGLSEGEDVGEKGELGEEVLEKIWGELDF